MRTSQLSRKKDPPSSKLAALRLVESGKHKTQKAQILAMLRNMGPNLMVTSAELAHYMKIDRYAAGRRLPDLAKDGVVEKCGIKTCSINNTPAVTWRAIF